MKTTLLFLSVFLSASLFGQIISFSTNDTIILNQSETTIISFIDIDQNGVDDFKLFESDVAIALKGEQDSSKIYNGLFEFPNGGCVFAFSVKDSVMSGTSNWGYPSNSAQINLYDFGQFENPYLNSNYYLGFRFLIQDENLLYQTHYGCIDITLLLDGRAIIHGWSYENQPNTPITCSDEYLDNFIGLSELPNSIKTLIQILDLMGRETSFKPNTPLIYVYDDGSIEKVFSVEY